MEKKEFIESIKHIVSSQKIQEEVLRRFKRRKIQNQGDENLVPNDEEEASSMELKKTIVECLLKSELPIDSSSFYKKFMMLRPNFDLRTTKWATMEQLLTDFAKENDSICLEAIELVRKNALVVVHVNRVKLLEHYTSQPPSLKTSISNTTDTLDNQINSRMFIKDSFLQVLEPYKYEKKICKHDNTEDIDEILMKPTQKSKMHNRIYSEVKKILDTPTFKQRISLNRFMTKGGTRVREYCNHGTKDECRKINQSNYSCDKIHFRRIIMPHTDLSIGDCSYLDTCRHMKTCKFVHYEIDQSDDFKLQLDDPSLNSKPKLPIQWLNVDVRKLDMTILGKFSVIMADPPWDIHMNLPYGTMSDDEMRAMNIKCLQDDGLFFLWVTGRAMELGRECLQIWGYERVEEVVWIKTNQLQRIIRTGRTGHWLNHSKEHCLVGMKGNPNLNRFIDCDVIVAEVRETSRKPDEIYGMIDRLYPNTRKLEIFGRPHNVYPGWLTLGNQLGTNKIEEPELLENFTKWEAKQKSSEGQK